MKEFFNFYGRYYTQINHLETEKATRSFTQLAASRGQQYEAS